MYVLYSGKIGDISPLAKLKYLNWEIVFLASLISSIGFLSLYSASGGDWYEWSHPQFLRYLFTLCIMFIVALTDIKTWFKYAYVFYALVLGLLLIVEIKGHIGMGAQRWIKIGFFVIQPSELMKPALVLVLARYFNSLNLDRDRRLFLLIPPILLIILPVCLVLLQPNLGTAMLLILTSLAIFILAGFPLWKLIVCAVPIGAAIPIIWSKMHNYQKQRVLTFLDPENDPLGAGYNIIQSKIALGSGGIFGKGFMNGTQGQLKFLPEKHTDFIFVIWAEEFGMIGATFLLLLFVALITYSYVLAFNCRHQFGRLASLGIGTTIFLYIIVNTSMVMGLIPAVGIPMPLVSYGGTAQLTIMICIGLLLSISLHRNSYISRGV
ncbi:MAG: rod shape-determining protein RodA [Alphaproteobacteria bacterium]|jgi:rod shape determining protein RodA|nr:rod shape-determining protein RodA [Alphaproteobacteria bacterium]